MFGSLQHLSEQQLVSLVHEAQELLKERRVFLGVPVEVFATELSPAEAAVKFLKDHGLSFHEIGLHLNRDERGVWGSYRRASRKMSEKLVVERSESIIPFSVLSDRTTSMLESVTLYLKDVHGLKLSSIARLLNKHSSTIWTVYSRAKKKRSIV